MKTATRKLNTAPAAKLDENEETNFVVVRVRDGRRPYFGAGTLRATAERLAKSMVEPCRVAQLVEGKLVAVDA